MRVALVNAAMTLPPAPQQPQQEHQHAPHGFPQHTPHGYQPHAPAPHEDAINDFVKTVTAKFSINQLVILGGCALLFIFLFLPFVTVNMRAIGIQQRISTSGFSMIFGDSGSLGGFLNLLLPIFAVAGLSFAKLANAKMLVLGVAFLGAYINLAMLLGPRIPMQSIGVGLILSFIMWVAVTAAAYMDFKGINLLNDLVKK